MARSRGMYPVTGFATNAPGYDIRRRKRALIERDPLGIELTETLRKLYGACEQERAHDANLIDTLRRLHGVYEDEPVSSELSSLWNRARDLQAQLERKYCTHVSFPNPERWLEGFAGRPLAAERLDQPWKLTEGALGLDEEALIRGRVNWTLPEGTNLILDLPPRRRPRPRVSGPPDGRPAPPTVGLHL